METSHSQHPSILESTTLKFPVLKRTINVFIDPWFYYTFSKYIVDKIFFVGFALFMFWWTANVAGVSSGCVAFICGPGNQPVEQ